MILSFGRSQGAIHSGEAKGERRNEADANHHNLARRADHERKAKNGQEKKGAQEEPRRAEQDAADDSDEERDEQGRLLEALSH